MHKEHAVRVDTANDILLSTFFEELFTAKELALHDPTREHIERYMLLLEVKDTITLHITTALATFEPRVIQSGEQKSSHEYP